MDVVCFETLGEQGLFTSKLLLVLLIGNLAKSFAAFIHLNKSQLSENSESNLKWLNYSLQHIKTPKLHGTPTMLLAMNKTFTHGASATPPPKRRIG